MDAGRTELRLRLLVPVSYWSIPTRLKAVEQWRTVVRGLDAEDPAIPLRLRLAGAYADWLSGDIDEAVGTTHEVTAMSKRAATQHTAATL